MKERVLSKIMNGTENEDVESTVEQPEVRHEPPIHQLQVPKGKKKLWYKPLIAAVLTVSLVGNGIAIIYFSNDQEKVEPAPAPEESSLDTVREMISLSPSEGIEAEATAMMIEQNDATNLVVHVEDLPSLKGEETYQVWVLQDGRPSRAGTFILNEKGIGAASYIINEDTDHQWDTIAITKEPNANSQEPKGDMEMMQVKHLKKYGQHILVILLIMLRQLITMTKQQRKRHWIIYRITKTTFLNS